MSSYTQELDALQRWVWEASHLKSMRLVDAPPQVARPVILWEAPSRQKVRETAQSYTMRTSQFGKVYAESLNKLVQYQEALTSYLEDGATHRPPCALPMFGEQGAQIGWLRNVRLEFTQSENLDVKFKVTYDVAYTRLREPDAPPATIVGQRMEIRNW